jgi:hypothetical protein
MEIIKPLLPYLIEYIIYYECIINIKGFSVFLRQPVQAWRLINILALWQIQACLTG